MATPTSSRRVQCRLCPKTITLNNFSTHIRVKHPAQAGRNPRSQWFSELGSAHSPLLALPSAPVAAPDSEPHPGPVPLAVADPERAPGLPPLDLDDIVLAVTEQLAEPNGLLPVAHLPALFAWREATALFLRSVSS